MDVKFIPEKSEKGVFAVSDLARAIDNIGRNGFSKAVFQLVHAVTRCEHFTIFRLPLSGAPQYIMAEDVGGAGVSRGIARLYTERFWRVDPVRPSRVSSFTAPQVEMVVASELGDGAYRVACFDDVNLRQRMTLFSGQNDECLRVSFYWSALKAIDPALITALQSLAPLITSLASKDLAYRRAQPVSLPGYEERLKSVAPSLTPREREVCARIVYGLTSEGIALDLDVSVNTILTHRRRAYARLNISSQNELMRLTAS